MMIINTFYVLLTFKEIQATARRKMNNRKKIQRLLEFVKP